MPYGNPESIRAMHRSKLAEILFGRYINLTAEMESLVDRGLETYISQWEYYNEWHRNDPERAVTLIGIAVARAEQLAELAALTAKAFSDDYDDACLENFVRAFVKQY